MKNILKIPIIFISLFIFNNKVYATDYLKGFTINNSEELNKTEIKGSDASIIGESAGNTYFKLAQIQDGNENTIAYCTDGDKDVYKEEQTKMTKNCHQITNNRESLVYAIEHGYNYSKHNTNYSSSNYLTGDYVKDYYITQAAVWYYTRPSTWMNNFDFNANAYNGKSTGVITNITKLINDANKAKTGASLAIEINDINMTLTSDKKYYISKPIKINGSYLSGEVLVNIVAGNDTFATTEQNGTTGKKSFSNNSTIYIKTPNTNDLNSNVDIRVSFTTKTLINESQIIECNHETREESQPMLIYVPKETTMTQEINLKVTTPKYPVKIIKQDNIDNKALAGAKLTIKNSDEKEVVTWVSDSAFKTIELKPGIYTLEEQTAPNGYIKSDNALEFTIDNEGNVLVENKIVSEIVITNKPILVTISKRSITGSNELKGAKLKITDKNGNIVKDVSGKELEWTSTDKPKNFQLNTGDYILSETISPKGYELSETTIEFTINEEGKVLIDGKEVKNNLIIFKNTPEPKQVPTGSVLIYVAGTLCLLSLGVAIYIIIKRKEL